MGVSSNAGLRMSAHGREITESFERFRPVAYDDKRPTARLRPGDRIYGTLTIGYGHTAGVHIGQIVTPAEADAMLSGDLAGAEAAVVRMVARPVSQGQFDALVDFVINAGPGNFSTSTLLKLVNASAPDDQVIAQFRRWTRSKGEVMAGLIRRRDAEVMLWTGQQAPLGLFGMSADEIMPHGDIEPDGMVLEDTAAVFSKHIWGHVTQAFGGATVAMAAGWQWLSAAAKEAVGWMVNNPDQVQSAGQQLKDVGATHGVNWLQVAGGVVISAVALYLFWRRFHQIKVEAKR